MDLRPVLALEALARLCDRLCGLFLMLQAALADCLLFDFLPFPQNGFVAPEVDVCGCDVVQALAVTPVVVVVDERADLAFKIAGQIVIIQKNSVLHGLVPAFPCPAVYCVAMSREGSCLAFADGTVRHGRASFFGLPAIQPNLQRSNMSHCHSITNVYKMLYSRIHVI